MESRGFLPRLLYLCFQAGQGKRAEEWLWRLQGANTAKTLGPCWR